MVRGRTSIRSVLKYEYANILGLCFCLSLSAHHNISPYSNQTLYKELNPFTDEAQTALFKDPVRTAL
jgi:hypothetical protein